MIFLKILKNTTTTTRAPKNHEKHPTPVKIN